MRFLLGLSVLSVALAAASPVRGDQRAVALQSGEWVVQANQFTYAICRQFVGEPIVSVQRCAQDLFAINPLAFFGEDPNRLRPGSRLRLPAWVLEPHRARAALPPVRDASNVVDAVSASSAVASTPPRVVATEPVSALATAASVSAELHAAPRAVPPPTVPPPYRDLVIGGVAAPEDPADAIQRAARDEALGQRSIVFDINAEHRTDQSGITSRARAHATNLHYRHETENFGEWHLDASLGSSERAMASGTTGTAARRGSRITLSSNIFPITERWVANSALGVVRTPINPFVTNSFRLSLPTPLFSGFATAVGDGSQEIRFAIGDIGTLDNLNASRFDQTAGRIIGLGGNLRLSRTWSVGVQAVNVTGALSTPAHSAVAAVLRRQTPGQAGELTVHALADDAGKFGAWLDTETELRATRRRWGVFYLPPELRWADTQIANDQRGFYWRTDHRDLRRFTNWGVNFTDTNIERARLRAGQSSVDGFYGGTLKLDRRLSIGGTVSVQQSRTHFTGGRTTSVTGNSFVSRNSGWGMSRADAARYLLRTTGSPVQGVIDTLSLSHDWSSTQGLSLSAALSASRENTGDFVNRRDSATVSVRSPLTSNVQWDTSFGVARISQRAGEERNFNFSLSAIWTITPDLTFSAHASWNTIDPSPPLPGLAALPFRREKRALLGLRYEQSSGRPYATQSGGGGARSFGTGGVVGVVFFDENEDGVRQANERGAPNINVYLDGRSVSTTDTTGRFQFRGVATGTHRLFIQAEGLPLPWSIENEKGFTVTVPIRAEAVQDFPLVRVR